MSNTFGNSQSRLTLSQQTTVAILRSVKASDDAQMLAYAAQLIAFEARPLVINRLTGMPIQIAKKLYEREVLRSINGRFVKDFGELIRIPIRHMELSYFVALMNIEMKREKGDVSAPSFIRSFASYKRIATPETLVKPESALALVDMLSKKEIELHRCEVDGMPFMRTTEIQALRWVDGRGNCPCCRALVVAHRTKSNASYLREPNIEKCKARFERLLNNTTPRRSTPE